MQELCVSATFAFLIPSYMSRRFSSEFEVRAAPILPDGRRFNQSSEFV